MESELFSCYVAGNRSSFWADRKFISRKYRKIGIIIGRGIKERRTSVLLQLVRRMSDGHTRHVIIAFQKNSVTVNAISSVPMLSRPSDDL
jgi:hypothetical protein